MFDNIFDNMCDMPRSYGYRERDRGKERGRERDCERKKESERTKETERERKTERERGREVRGGGGDAKRKRVETWVTS